MTEKHPLSVREKAQAIVGHYPPSLPYPCPPACKRCAQVEELIALGQEYAKHTLAAEIAARKKAEEELDAVHETLQRESEDRLRESDELAAYKRAGQVNEETKTAFHWADTCFVPDNPELTLSAFKTFARALRSAWNELGEAKNERDNFREMISKLNVRLRVWEKDGPAAIIERDELRARLEAQVSDSLTMNKILRLEEALAAEKSRADRAESSFNVAWLSEDAAEKRAKAAEQRANEWKVMCEAHSERGDRWRWEYFNLQKFANDSEAQVSALTSKLEDISCEFCEDGAKCCEKFDNSYGEMLNPFITVCAECWNRAAEWKHKHDTLTSKLDASEKLVERARVALNEACFDYLGRGDHADTVKLVRETFASLPAPVEPTDKPQENPNE